MFLFFHGILSDTPKKSRGKNLQHHSQGLSSGGDKRGDPGNEVEKFDQCYHFKTYWEFDIMLHILQWDYSNQGHLAKVLTNLDLIEIMEVNNSFPTNYPCKSSCTLQRQQICGHFG